ncbi:MAG: FkbM family methyltransferase [Phycisphaerales bacterium]|nr:FkbM family methyltransferase [Phycisphaerales bacterium]MCI0629837.1 FkbM family methyltransferase [Phycisphaerales bacterium]
MRHGIAHAKRLLKRTRRRINQLLKRDLPYNPQVRCPRLRLGSDYGGWVINPQLVDRDSIIYSFGVGVDITFDLELIRRFGATVHAFDPTPKSIEWVRNQRLPQQFVFHEIGLADFDGAAQFVLPRPHMVSYRQYSNPEHVVGTEAVTAPVQRLSTIMSDLRHDRIDLLKMDIEGAEHAALADLCRSQISVRQLLVEFHHVIGDAASLQPSRNVIELLLLSGFRIFDVSPDGFEYAFIHQRSGAV